MTKPLGLTMGDGAGLGPELLLRSYRALSEAGLPQGSELRKQLRDAR